MAVTDVPKTSVLTGQKQGRDRAVRLRNQPNCFVGVRAVTAQEPESVLQAVLVLPAIFLGNISPLCGIKSFLQA
jgi:hypothetical protein